MQSQFLAAITDMPDCIDLIYNEIELTHDKLMRCKANPEPVRGKLEITLNIKRDIVVTPKLHISVHSFYYTQPPFCSPTNHDTEVTFSPRLLLPKLGSGLRPLLYYGKLNKGGCIRG